jgi:hypothetical protein
MRTTTSMSCEANTSAKQEADMAAALDGNALARAPEIFFGRPDGWLA